MRITCGGFAQTARMGKAVVQSKEDKLRRALAISFLFFFCSFAGWCIEKIWFQLAYGVNEDRGFLTLPLCPIYGGSLLVIRLLFGLPVKQGEGYPQNVVRLLIYGAGAALVATAAELLTGWIFDTAFDLRLWSYRGYPHQWRGYICLPMSVAWGGMIAAAMGLIWSPLERVLSKLPSRPFAVLNAGLWIMISLDFCVNLSALF